MDKITWIKYVDYKFNCNCFHQPDLFHENFAKFLFAFDNMADFNCKHSTNEFVHTLVWTWEREQMEHTNYDDSLFLVIEKIVKKKKIALFWAFLAWLYGSS